MKKLCWRPVSCAVLILFISSLSGGCDSINYEPAPESLLPRPGAADFVGSANCSSCHAVQYENWSGSHHDLAMQHASSESVRGDFDNAAIRVAGVDSSFFIRDDRFWVTTDNEEGNLAEFEVKYTFGVEPLQQYLIEFSSGRLQTLPLAWDDRDEAEGGQRWFHIYENEPILYDDPLHWTGREQNWNYMCAECHSTNLRKNFDRDAQTFNSTWSEINVGCEACHGPGSRHVANAESGPLRGSMGLLVDLDDTGRAVWIMNTTTGIAERSEFRVRPPQQADSCGRCHSRRSVITPEYQYGLSLLDTHMPALLDERLYYSDGQIQEEVYVWGSFLQSKMYRAGVTCTDCHDPHTARLKSTGDASAICSTCHLPSRFDRQDHHKHEPERVSCVDCHMPSRDYMTIDGRRDHSFRLPRPDLSISTGSPNACHNCHSEKGPEWASARLGEWFGDTKTIHYANAIHAGRNHLAGANSMLAAAASDASYPGIARATSLSLLASPLDSVAAGAIREGLNSTDPLIRLGALRALNGVSNELRMFAVRLLEDPLRSVRLEAASLLSPVRNNIPQSSQAAFNEAERDYVEAQLAIAERPEAHANLAAIYLARNDTERAEASYLRALAMEPLAVLARVNLADLYRQTGRDADARVLLQTGLSLDSDSSALHHSLGLLLVRTGAPEAALDELERAAAIDPGNRRYAYVFGVALNSLGRVDDAIRTMRAARLSFPGDFDIGWGLVTMLYASGHADEALNEGLRLQSEYPENPDVADFVRRLTNP